ncbi:hypothetical protein BKA93DRAFT_32450 [Sparassis latifolia]
MVLSHLGDTPCIRYWNACAQAFEQPLWTFDFRYLALKRGRGCVQQWHRTKQIMLERTRVQSLQTFLFISTTYVVKPSHPVPFKETFYLRNALATHGPCVILLFNKVLVRWRFGLLIGSQGCCLSVWRQPVTTRHRAIHPPFRHRMHPPTRFAPREPHTLVLCTA